MCVLRCRADLFSEDRCRIETITNQMHDAERMSVNGRLDCNESEDNREDGDQE